MSYLKAILGIPEHVVPVAYLCMGYVSEFKRQPELESKGWRKRLPLEELIYFDQWQQQNQEDSLIQHISEKRDAEL